MVNRHLVQWQHFARTFSLPLFPQTLPSPSLQLRLARRHPSLETSRSLSRVPFPVWYVALVGQGSMQLPVWFWSMSSSGNGARATCCWTVLLNMFCQTCQKAPTQVLASPSGLLPFSLGAVRVSLESQPTRKGCWLSLSLPGSFLPQPIG